jgi:hypothetical protein
MFVNGLWLRPLAASGLLKLIWRTRDPERQAYNFSHDHLDRLRSAVYADVNDAGTVTLSKHFNESLTYADARGSISIQFATYLPPTIENGHRVCCHSLPPKLGLNKVGRC